MHVIGGRDFADTQTERAAVMRRSIHVLEILCFRLPALLRYLVTTKREARRERETLEHILLTLFLTFAPSVVYFTAVATSVSSLSCQ